jgi:DNA-binding MarR family transcriptional regulator
LGTAQENMDDKVAKGRQSRGTLGHNTLSEGDVLLIRELAPSVKQTDLAARFNISQANVSKIIRRQLWLHI